MKFLKIMLMFGSFLLAGAQLQASVSVSNEPVATCSGGDTCSCPPKN